jgi:23S rRNA pseudouridine955/2504/2580 synthase
LLFSALDSLKGFIMINVRHMAVSEQDDGQRLDRWFKKNVPEMPYVLVQKMIRKGAVRVDGKRADMDTRLAAGQDIRIPPVEVKTKTKKEYVPNDRDRALLDSITIYDDGDIIAFNKPSGLASQGGGGVEWQIDEMLVMLADRKGRRPMLIHRLDRDTSGVLLCARSPSAIRNLGRSMMGRQAMKIYWALTIPAPEVNDGLIRAPLAKATGPLKDRMIISEGPDAKHAATDYKVIERAMNKAAFVAFRPQTGRTHQIRVHAADVLGCPLIGDDKYGGADARISDDLHMADRLHLHARRLRIPHPTLQNKMLDITAPLPPELEKSWKSLGFDYKGVDEDPFADLDL